MASDSPQPAVPVDDAGFRKIVEWQVEVPLRDSIARADLPVARLVQEVIENRTKILREAAPYLERIEDLRQRLAVRRALRTGSAFLGGALGVLAVSRSVISLPSWVPLASLALAGFVLVLTVARVLVTFLNQRSRPATGGSASSSPLPLEDQLIAAEQDYRQALEQGIRRWVTDRANELLGLIYSATLPELDPQGLAEIDGSEHEIPTRAREALDSLVTRMPGGSIGVSGPRGAGKSTLLRRVTTEAWRDDPSTIRAAITVDAPVEYEARDFVLHLFAQLCEAVLKPARVEAMRGWKNGYAQPAGRQRFRSFTPFPWYVGPLLLAIGAIAYFQALNAQGELDLAHLELLTRITFLVGVVLTYISVFGNLVGTRGTPPGLFGRLWKQEDELERRAERHLRQIWYQRTYSSGWSGALKGPVGVQVGTERTEQLAENQLSFPDLVNLYKSFVKALIEHGQVRIGIDELDKMDDERARRFLDEIKVIFRISGCFYFVSVSEDAMAYFERRGLPFRDVFDSSFDAVLQVGHLTYADSRQLLRRRVVGLPSQFIALGHVIGGGLARDVIRAARDICGHEPGTDLQELASIMCVGQLAAKCTAARVTARRLKDPGRVSLVSRWLTSVEASSNDSDRLLERCRRFDAEFTTRLGPPPQEGEDELVQYREALLIALEILAFAYFVDTLQDLLPRLATAETTRGAIHDGSIDRLAEARQAFAINPAQAWEVISEIRVGKLGQEDVSFPPYPDGRPSPRRGTGLIDKLRGREPDRGLDGTIPGLAAGDRGR
jgi:hypothetical protein